MSAMSDSARGRRVTRNRPAETVSPTPSTPSRRLVRTTHALVTVLLLAPAAALLAARGRTLVRLDAGGLGPGCTGVDTLGPVLHAGVPVIALALVLPAALLSLGHRGRGWIAIGVVLVAVLALEVALRTWLPACL